VGGAPGEAVPRWFRSEHERSTEDHGRIRSVLASNCGFFFEWPFVQCTATIAARHHQGSGSSLQPAGDNGFSCRLDFESMYVNAQRRKRRERVLSSLNVAIEASNLAKESCSITPAKPVFASFSVILTMIKVYSLLPRLRWSVGD
jgi:hypothetical protein